MQERRTPPRPPLSLAALVEGIRRQDRAILGRAITLVESENPRHQEDTQALLQAILPFTGQSHRIGISGVPGAGKSTLIEGFGMWLLSEGHRVAVLAVDPSSSLSRGSILGDKTRMHRLSTDPRAFIRPSPSGGALGGVARKTRESLLVCEAAGFDIVLVETVGVGQSEAIVAQMVDCFLVLMLAGAGDELQGIKRGILEMADLIAFNKADSGGRLAAEAAQKEYQAALRLMRPPHPGEPWAIRVLTTSSLQNETWPALWQAIQDHRHAMQKAGAWEKRRSEQKIRWMWSLVENTLLQTFRQSEAIQALLPLMENKLLSDSISPTAAALELLHAFGLPQKKDVSFLEGRSPPNLPQGV